MRRPESEVAEVAIVRLPQPLRTAATPAVAALLACAATLTLAQAPGGDGLPDTRQSSAGHEVHAAPVPLAPVWCRQPADGIEWVHLVAAGDTHDLLFATRSARLELLELQNGERRLEQPIVARPGVRPAAGSADGRVYCFDRFTVYSIQVSPVAAVRWQVGAWPQGLGAGITPPVDPVTFQGDPEELPGITAAQADRRGVLVAGQRGRVGLLDREDGHVLWQRRFRAASNLCLHSRADQAVLFWKSGARLAARFVDSQTGRSQVIKLPAEAAWPIWSALATDGLVLVHPRRWGLWVDDGDYHIHASPGASHILAASVALAVVPADAGAAAPREALVFGTSDGRLHAAELATGAPLWTVADQKVATGGWARVTIDEGLVIAATAHSATLYHLQDGSELTRFHLGRDARLLDVALHGRTVWLLHADQQDAGRLSLTAFPRSRTTGAETTARPRHYLVGSPNGFLQAVWADGRLIVATRSSLRAYVLP